MSPKSQEKEIKKKKKNVRKRKKVKISRSTLYAIGILIVLFILWQLVLVPLIVGNISTPPVGQIPPIKRGDIKFVNEQISKRTLKNIPSLVPPKTDLGKKNPFE